MKPEQAKAEIARLKSLIIRYELELQDQPNHRKRKNIKRTMSRIEELIDKIKEQIKWETSQQNT